MIKPIRTYEDLLVHKQQTEVLLQAQKELVIYDLKKLQSEFKGATSALSFIGKLVTRNKKNMLINFGVNKVLDVVLRKVILSRAGWLTKLTVPFFLKNISSHFLAGHKEELIDKLSALVGKSHQGNGHAAPEIFEGES